MSQSLFIALPGDPNFLNLKIILLKIFGEKLFWILECFLILNPYNFVPLTSQIKIDINYVIKKRFYITVN
tara:strand:- start:59 stop:268 length:210 start_codon:yes stop_codon:yes gene_type:complete